MKSCWLIENSKDKQQISQNAPGQRPFVFG